jgi:hypothetical protein
MNLLERVASEYDSISNTDFWRLYLVELINYRKLKLDKLSTCPVEQDEREKGEISCLKFVDGLPTRILTQLKNEANKQEV